MNCLKVCILGPRSRLVVVWAAEAACRGEHSNGRQQWWWGGTGNLSDSVSIQMEILASETTETTASTETTEPLTTDTEPTPLPRLLLPTTGVLIFYFISNEVLKDLELSQWCLKIT